MILAETTTWITVTTNVLLVIDVMVCLLLCLVVLMQRPKQEGLGAAFGGGMTDQAFGARTTDVLQKGTVYLGSAFFVITFILSILTSAPTYADQKIQKDKEEAAKVEEEQQKVLANKETQDEVNAGIEAAEEATPAEPAASETPAEPAPAEDAQPAAEETPAEDASAAETPSSEEPAPQEEPKKDGE
ncbi:hypothetical protein Rhal01_00882 [Rubritalea halochordaticola]|uniref:Protein-export membrane protein SecG n=1 Tax=Rubritalea halochordaticola TaxID=714537 RepID=A0ABP9UW81_9BACT